MTPAAAWNAQSYILERLGCRKVLDTTFIAGFMFSADIDAGNVQKYFSALKRAQMDLDLEPERYKARYAKELPPRYAKRAEVRRSGRAPGSGDQAPDRALGLAPDVCCLEVGGGRGSIARWLCQDVAARGQVTATDLDTGFLSELSLPNLTVLRHDVRADGFPEGSFGLVHVRAVLMHIAGRMAVLRRMASWLAPRRLAGGRGSRLRHVAG